MSLSPIDVRFFKLAIPTIRSESDDDICVRCPICGDSHLHNKARLHLYEKNGKTFVNCFNGGCPVSNKTMYSFLREYYPDLFSQYKRELFKTKIQPSQLRSSDTVDWFDSVDTPCKPSTEKVDNSLKPIFTTLNNECKSYIDSRQVESKGIFTAAGDVDIDGKKYPINGFILIPLIKGKEIYGFYSRSPRTKTFFTYIKPNFVGLKAWNLFKVNLDEPVYIFEGIFDALSAVKCGLTNVVALLGAKPSDEIMTLIKHPVFCLDNDRTGMLNSLTYCKHNDVVVWPDRIKEKDCNEMLIGGKDVKDIIINNIHKGIRAEILLRSKL